jgi:hypothetical protein
MNFEEKSIEIIEAILKAVHKKDDPIKDLLEAYMKKHLEETYNEGLINSKTPY